MSGIVGGNIGRSSGSVEAADNSIPQGVARGGTGAATHTANNVLVGNGTSAIASVAPSTSGNILTSNGSAWTSAAAAGGGGKVLQCISVISNTTSSTTSAMTNDNSIPQNNEGGGFVFSQAITPASASNILMIHCVFQVGTGNASLSFGGALFQDSTANALSYSFSSDANGGNVHGTPLFHRMVAGTTSATTFKVRFGGSGGTTYWNRRPSGNTYGGVLFSSMCIWEIEV